MQIRKPPEAAFIQITVEVQEPTLSFLLGSKWLNVDASDREALSEVWQTVALAHSAAATYTAAAMADMDTLSKLVQCKHTDILPAAVAEPTLTTAAVETAPAASRPLVLLIHALGTVAASMQAAIVPGLRNLRLEDEMKQLALQHLSEHDGREHVVMPDQRDAVPALVRCAILLLKLADLTPARAAEDVSVALWMAIAGVVRAFREQWGFTEPPSASQCCASQGSAEQQQPTLVLVQLILRMLRDSQGRWQTSESGSEQCFQLLSCLVAQPATLSTAIPAIYTKGNVTALTLVPTLSCHSSGWLAQQYRWYCSRHAKHLPAI